MKNYIDTSIIWYYHVFILFTYNERQYMITIVNKIYASRYTYEERRLEMSITTKMLIRFKETQYKEDHYEKEISVTLNTI